MVGRGARGRGRATPGLDLTAGDLVGLTITKVTPGVRDPTRVTLRAERRAIATIDDVTAHRLRVKVGLTIGEDLAAAILAAVGEDRLRRIALRRVARSACSVRALHDALVRKGATREQAGRIAADMERLGYVSDAEFARAKARAILARKPCGARLIEARLRAAGIGRELAASAAKEVTSGRDAGEDAEALARRVARGLASRLDAEAKRRRLLAALARRGFDHGSAARAVAAVMKG